MRLASLAMYVSQPPLIEASDALWAFVRDRLCDAGLTEVPETLDKTIGYDDAWLQPNLLLAQTCGFPYVKRLRSQVRLVATPVYSLPGCNRADMRSFIIVRGDMNVSSLEDLRGMRAAINSPDSNSGVNLFRAAIAPLAHEGRFFSSVVETGGHMASIDAVAAAKADVASIDCVTFGNTRRFDPGRLAKLRVIAETESGPGLPLITHADTGDHELALMRKVLADVATAPEMADVRDTLSLKRFDVLSDACYERLADLERRAISLGYPKIA